MTTPTDSPRRAPHSHAVCGARWSGSRAAHCSGCCRTFSGVTLFDRHRSLAGGEHGRCLDPADFGDVELRDGLWCYPEMTAAQKAAAFGKAS